MAALNTFARALLLLIATQGAAQAQRAPVFVDTEHWSWDVVRRLNGMGLAPPASDPAAAPMTQQHARRVLEHAAEAAHAPSTRALLQGWLERLHAEGDTTGAVAHLDVRVGWSTVAGQALAGDGYFPDEDWQGARPLPRATSLIAGLSAHGHVAPWLAWSVDGGRLAHDWAVTEGALTAAVGSFDLWAGRRRLHYGVARGGGTVLGAGLHQASDLTQRVLFSLDGGGVHTRQPFRYPSFLGFLGHGRIEIAGGRLPRNGIVAEPLVVFGRVTMTPFTPRLLLAVNRGAIFGGQGNPITARRLGGLLLGLHGGDAGEFENQVFSVAARARPPLGPLPLELYVEWGMDDTAGAIRDTPGIIAGADLAAIPGVPALSLAVERAHFPASCCGNPIWYRSIFFRGSWAGEGRLFAHPVGGHGSEWLGHVRLDLPGHGLMMRAAGFVRDRGHENLFAPERAGRSRGGSIHLEYRIDSGSGLHVSGGVEDGSGWNGHTAAVFLTHSPRLRR